MKKLAYVRRVQGLQRPEEIVRQLLTCVYQSTRNSGPVTLKAAEGLATALNAEFLHFDVDGVVQDYISLVSKGLGRQLSWETDDLALQNIQARARSPGVWMVANLRGALLLSTSNRSEAAVGYATMDGDTSGGVSPDRRDRQGILATLVSLAGEDGACGSAADSGVGGRERAGADGRAAPAGVGADGRGRPDAV